MSEKPLIIALSKGRILDETLPLLKHAGIELLEDPSASRKLIFDTTRDDVQIIIIRATDVPPYVQHGAADIGVAGKDVLMEHGADGVFEPLDLDIARCKLMVAAVNRQGLLQGGAASAHYDRHWAWLPSLLWSRLERPRFHQFKISPNGDGWPSYISLRHIFYSGFSPSSCARECQLNHGISMPN